MAYESLAAMFADIAGAIRGKELSEGSIPAEEFAARIRGLETANTSCIVGTTWIITGDGTWIVPASGSYDIELHGGGGGGSDGITRDSSPGRGGGGGGSGEIFKNVTLTMGTPFTVVVGKGGAHGDGSGGKKGGTTSFGSYSVEGGGGGASANSNGYGGHGSGSLASNGADASTGYESYGGAGGSGGASIGNYGDGGDGGGYDIPSTGGPILYDGANGSDGVVIITYIGE